jgi:hypothetical protein
MEFYARVLRELLDEGSVVPEQAWGEARLDPAAVHR